jgi:hypothetical protein
VADRRATPHIGSGGSDGSARNPPASIATTRGARIFPPAANDNRPPMRLRLLRLARWIVLLAFASGTVWYLMQS